MSFAGLRVTLAVVFPFTAAWIFRKDEKIHQRALLIADLAQKAFQGLLVLDLNPSYGTTAGNTAILTATQHPRRCPAGWL